MVASDNTVQAVTSLQAALQAESSGKLERLAADLFSRLLQVQFAVSRSGFQHGGDAGTSGQQGRHLRLESKRYADVTPLKDRELQGEMDDALRRDPNLEAWILVSTRSVAETTRDTLTDHAEKTGLPIFVIDWTPIPGRVPDLAALCTVAPDIVESHYGRQVALHAKSLTDIAKSAVERLNRDLQSWCIAYDSLKNAADTKICKMWASDSEARAQFAQNVAIGAAQATIERTAIISQFEAWWKSRQDRPAVAFGNEGVGKTWAVFQWMHQALPSLPIVVLLPSSSLPDLRGLSDASVLEFIARELHRLTTHRSDQFWRKRLRALLERPEAEGPALLLLIDGLNQEPEFEWIRLLQILQGNLFKGRVRVILTTQTNYLENGLNNFHGLSRVPTRIGIDPYDISEGGELDQMLALHKLVRSDLAPELIPLARMPRLFRLVVKFRESVATHGDVTVSRLLWAYGRNELGLREGRVFSEAEWEAWLQDLAKKVWQDYSATGIASSSFTVSELSEVVSQPHRNSANNYKRLNEIIDNTWMEPVPDQPLKFRPKSETIALALGLALINHLESSPSDKIAASLAHWIDPIQATPMAANILDSSLAILVAKSAPSQEIASCILTALLQSQNVSDVHRRDVVALAPVVPISLMDAIERSHSRAQASARHWANTALQQVSSSNLVVWEKVCDRLQKWVSIVTCPSPAEKAQNDGSAEHRTKRLMERIGRDEAGTMRVLGVPLRLQYAGEPDLSPEIPRLLQGKPLGMATKVFEAAAVAAAVGLVNNGSWQGLKWLITFDSISHQTTVSELANIADAVVARSPESGVHSQLPARVGALLLWLTGEQKYEEKADAINPPLDTVFSRQKDYLDNPSNSFFKLEREHVDLVLQNDELSILRKAQRIRPYLADPRFEVPASVESEVRAIADQLDVSKLDVSRHWSQEDHTFEDFETAAARFAPGALASAIRKRLHDVPNRTGGALHWGALRGPDYLLLAGKEEGEAARRARLSMHDGGDQEPFARMQLLAVEIASLRAEDQLDAMACDDLAWLTNRLLAETDPMPPFRIDEFLEAKGTGNRRAIEALLDYLATHAIELSAYAFDQLYPFSQEIGEESLRIVAFVALGNSSPLMFGQKLLSSGWSAGGDQSVHEMDYGSLAVLAAAKHLPLSDLRNIVASWRLLQEAKDRGADALDVKVAAAEIDKTVMFAEMPAVDMPAVFSIDTSDSLGRVSFEEKEDGENDITRAFDDEYQTNKYRTMQKEGAAYVKSARGKGAKLYAINFPPANIRMLVDHASAQVDSWLEGMERSSDSFRKRLSAASGLFLAICEVLLEVDPARGATLWRRLNAEMPVRHVGLAGINELLHLPFKVPASAPVLEVREQLFSVRRTTTEKDYLDLVVCALVNGAESWLGERIAADEGSGSTWRLKRGAMLRGMAELPVLAEEEWPEGWSVGTLTSTRREAVARKLGHSLSYYWWEQYLTATTGEAAYAAWKVFLTCVDRRCWIWLTKLVAKHRDANDTHLWRAKMRHFEFNRGKLDAAIHDRERKGTNAMNRHLWGWDEPSQWLDMSKVRDGDRP
ncbi:hypothetical protein [Pseudoxanthomonas sacheonensis]|uniref:NACHT domain-containing protein n=1 Tax=Pseudoxanthomonas sacheonensis TaxID=443615 RepID=A0ABU1RRD8_9GAMM|nr:hypothetical protein [Pseudoxanthomonas sacheonensis]MDR6841326.1 hypothetical protein [Pseudoxanthomonas sacheonensis]